MRELPGGRLEVFTFKEGLLSSIAHDLKLEIERFEIRSDGARVAARVHTDSLRVVGVIKGSIIDHSLLAERDRQEIVKNIRTKILDSDRHPDATFDASVEQRADHHELCGTFT